MKKRIIRVVAVVLCVCMMSTGFTSASSDRVVVRVDPKLGRHVGTLRIFMTRAELRTVQLMERQASTVLVPDGFPAGLAARWFIEPSARDSTTLAISREALVKLQALFENVGLVRTTRTNIVIGRTQQFINESLDAIGCKPNLARTGGIHLMGSSLCDRGAIVINLTGYFFLHSIGDKLTDAMESWSEPRLDTLDYRIVARNLSGLAHEWAHVARTSATGGLVPTDEPAWLREGFAEVMAGIALVRLLGDRFTYTDFHVTRLRTFTDWGSVCREPLSAYQKDSKYLAGCEYYVGPLAVEYLIARMGGLLKFVALFHTASRLGNFARAFRMTYGMSISAFERKFDSYVRPIALLPQTGR